MIENIVKDIKNIIGDKDVYLGNIIETARGKIPLGICIPNVDVDTKLRVVDALYKYEDKDHEESTIYVFSNPTDFSNEKFGWRKF